jgi:hypothetical protein
MEDAHEQEVFSKDPHQRASNTTSKTRKMKKKQKEEQGALSWYKSDEGVVAVNVSSSPFRSQRTFLSSA